MADKVDKETRSRIMSSIRGKGTKMELAVKPVLEALGFEYQPKTKDIPGKPDFVNWGAQIAVFLDGCFWHGCPEHFKSPVNNREFWAKKIDANRHRDIEVKLELISRGWTVLRVWEHDLKELVKTIRK